MGREWKGKEERRGEREEKGNPHVADWENKKVGTLPPNPPTGEGEYGDKRAPLPEK